MQHTPRSAYKRFPEGSVHTVHQETTVAALSSRLYSHLHSSTEKENSFSPAHLCYLISTVIYLKTAIKSHPLSNVSPSDSHSVDGCGIAVLFIGFEWYAEHLRVFFAFSSRSELWELGSGLGSTKHARRDEFDPGRSFIML